MHDLSRSVSGNEILGRIIDLLPPGTYLVGGCIRDMLQGRTPLDFDLVTFAPVRDLALRIAERLGSRPFWMDEKRGVMRIALKATGVSIDISEPKGVDIAEDLKSRDLTINAMAYDVTRRELIDPISGMHDLTRGLIRIISEKNLMDDPLRGLRAARFSVTLDFAVHPETCRMIRKNAWRIRGISGERIKQEFAQALSSLYGATFFRLLTWKNLIPVLFHPYFADRDIRDDQPHPLFLSVLPFCEELDGIIYACDALMPGSSGFLAQETESGVPRAALLRLAAFLLGLENLCMPSSRGLQRKGTLQDIPPADRASGFCSDLHFSSRSIRMIRVLLEKEERTEGILSKKGGPSLLDIHRFCDEAAEYVPEALMLSLSRSLTREFPPRQVAAQVWEYYRSVYQEHKKSPLISGKDVISALGGAEGPQVGRWLRAVEEARAQGVIQTRNEAMEFLRRTVR